MNPQDLGFNEVTDIEVLSGSFLNLTCVDSEYVVNDTWLNNFFELECMHSGQFKDYLL